MRAVVHATLAVVGLAAGTVSAQDYQPKRDTTQPGVQPSTQPRRDTNLSDSNDPISVLRKTEGQWRVEVRAKPGFWSMKPGKEGMEPRRDTTPDRTNQPGQPDRTPPRDPNRPDRDMDKPDRNIDKDQPADRPSSTLGALPAKRGLCESKIAMDGSVLQQRTFIFDVDSDMNRDITSPSEPVQFVSYLSFDKPADRYSMVIVCGKDGSMKFDTGKYELSQDKIVFLGDHSGSDSDRTSPAVRPGGQSPSSVSPPDSGRNLGYGLGNHRVVLEILGADQHRVTMYSQDSKSTSTNPPGTPPTSPVSNPSQLDDSNIVYQATYTRISGADADKLQNLLREGEPISKPSPSTPTSPTTPNQPKSPK